MLLKTDILKSYKSDRKFQAREGEVYSDLTPIKPGVPQGSVLGPVLYLIYTSDVPEFEENIIATFADDTAVMAIGSTDK